MATAWSTSSGYGEARELKTGRIEVRGPTTQNREWLQGWGCVAKPNKAGEITYKLPIPMNNRDKAELLYGIVSRRMEWRVVAR